MKTNKILISEAREALSGKWHIAVLTTLVLCLITSAVSSIPKTGGLINLLMSGSFALGYAIFIISLSRKNKAETNMIFMGFKYFSKTLALFCIRLFFILLWTLLLIIPGIMAALSYSMVFYIMADDKEIGVMEAIKKSKKMMNGNRGKLFCLGLRFLGWIILSILTLGIGFLWLIPYASVAKVKFYDDIKNNGNSNY